MAAPKASEARLFGIRHLGPGSAATLVRALAEFKPDCVLVEGPPEAQFLLPMVADAGLKPPVALLVYRDDDPGRAALQPYASYSPEWVAIRYALAKRVAVSFIDLPQAVLLAMEDAPSDEGDEMRLDPLGELAQMTNGEDGERWWDEVVESNPNSPASAFSAVSDAMVMLRAEMPETNSIVLLREAQMRAFVRSALATHARVAVVCGAWHVPGLLLHDASGQDNVDARMLQNLPRTKVSAAWTPWSHERMTRLGGYQAGVSSPAWYDALWVHGDDAPVAWMTRAASLLRSADLDASTASVIHAVNMACGLASIRDRPTPVLGDLEDAALSVLCHGEAGPMALIHRDLVVGREMGTVPAGAPTTPLQADFERICRKLRLTLDGQRQVIELDLRKDTDLSRSVLFHRIGILGMDWATQETARASTGTFREAWALQWQPDFMVAMVGLSRLGSTVAIAAATALGERARASQGVAELAKLVFRAVEADLAIAAMVVVSALNDRAAVSHDVFDLMEAVPALAELSRYGSVRKTDTSMVAGILSGIVPRVAGGLVGACRFMTDEAAMEAADKVGRMGRAMTLVADAETARDWAYALEGLSTIDGVHGLVAGQATRLRVDSGALDAAAAGFLLGRALSRAEAPGQAACWLEGFLKSGATILIHGNDMLPMVDAWLCDLPDDHFMETLPVLRRAFSSLPSAERKAIGELIKGSGDDAPAEAAQVVSAYDPARMAAVMPVLKLLLGTTP